MGPPSIMDFYSGSGHRLTLPQVEIVRDNMIRMQALADDVDTEDIRRVQAFKGVVRKLTQEILDLLPQPEI